ncbi:MAG: hypothetical protein R6V61_05080 [Wenzhouxiangellaceae bacterium]
MRLHVAAHQDQTAVGGRKLEPAPAVAFSAQHETPLCTEAHRRDQRFAAEFGFVVGMPTHGIPSIAIKVQQNAVEAVTGFGLEGFAQRGNVALPGRGFPKAAGVGISDSRISLEGNLSRLHHFPAEHPDRSGLPVDFLPQRRDNAVGFQGIHPVMDIDQLTARRESLDKTVT